MKKRKNAENTTNNKGFSLVELIVVIAIMAVLVAVLAPQFTKYVDRSRQSNDAATVAGIVTAVQVGIADKTEYTVPADTYTITIAEGETTIAGATGGALTPVASPSSATPKNICNAVEDACGKLTDLKKTASKWDTITIAIEVTADSAVSVKYDAAFAAYIDSTDVIPASSRKLKLKSTDFYGKDQHPMTPELIPFVLIIVFLYGIVIGSFLNVCIYRIPKGESVAKEHSHCMSCGYRLRWYDLIPVCSWIFLHGKCRKCGAKISIQYPIVELCNGILYMMIFIVNGYNIESVFYCLMASALLVLSVIDLRTYEIPFGINIFLFVIGVIHSIVDRENWISYVAGFFAVSVLLEVILLASKGRAIGGGDVKLMAAAGLMLGWKQILFAFVVACIAGSVIHLARMKISRADRVLAMGPYLSAGILFSALWGEQMINWYLNYLIGR